MPAPKTRGDYDQLAQISNRFAREYEMAQRALNAVQQQVNTLQGGDWVGEGARAFYAEMNSAVLPSLKRLAKALQSAQQVTQQIGREVKAAEDEASRILRPPEFVLAEAPPTAGLAMQASSGSDDEVTDSDGNSVGGFLLDAGLSFVPIVGDALDILKQGWNAITGQAVDMPVLAMSVGGLLADLGWLDGPVPDPVDGANAVLAFGKAVIKRVPPGPVRDAIVDAITKAAKNPDDAARLADVFKELASNTDVVTALAKYPQGARLLLENGPELVTYLAKNGDAAGPAFANSQKFAEHVFKHADEFGYKNAQEYLEGARKLVASGPDVKRHVRANGDQLFYNQATNEFAVLTKDGAFRTYYKPVDDGTYWESQIR
jgi:WXG100 family type VII secretion target